MANIKEVIKKVVSNKNNKEWGEPISSYTLTFESQQSQLEPIYYWLLDFMNDGGWEKVEKITDNFRSSPGSGNFAEMGQRATKMQEESMKILGGLNQVIKSVLNLIYDLKEFEIRLEHYDDAKSEKKEKKEAGTLALKQIWLDNVDIKRQRGSIHAMANELGFTTIREAFMMANSVDDLKKMNKEDKDSGGGGLINDQVMRVLIPRVDEFLKWKDYSEKELRKRMNIEKSYLKSQVETIKLYSQWLKPYLRAAEELRHKGFDNNAALVNAFSTSMFELELLATMSIKEAPEKFEGYKLKRTYNPCVIIKMIYRGHVSQRVTQKGDYSFALGGRVDMTFDSYALNEEELMFIRKELEKEDIDESIKFSSDVASEALDEIKEDLDHFLTKDESKREKEEAKKKSEDINPFKALFNLFKKSGKKEKEKDKVESYEDIKPDNFVEKTVRTEAALAASEGLYIIYDIYKKAHRMASAPEPFENADQSKITEPTVKLKDIFKGQSMH